MDMTRLIIRMTITEMILVCVSHCLYAVVVLPVSAMATDLPQLGKLFHNFSVKILKNLTLFTVFH